MSWGDAGFWYPHTIQVEDTQGRGGKDRIPGATRSLSAEVKDQQRLVRAADGTQSVSSSTVTVPIDSAVEAGSLVTVWPGTPQERTAAVIAVQRDENDDDLDSHLILSLE